MKVPPKEQKAPEVYGIQRLTAIMAESGDLDTILRRSLAGILQLLGLPTGRICLQEERKNRFVTRASRGVPRAIAPLLGPFRKGEGFFGRTVRHDRPCLIPDLLKERKRRKIPPEVIEAGYRFFYSVPLSHHGEVLGRLELYSRKPAALSAFDRGLVELFSNHLGCKISRMLLIDKMARDISDRKGAETELAQRYKEITSIQAISDALSHADTLEAMLERVGHQIIALTGCKALGFYLLDEQAPELRLVAPVNVPDELVKALSRLPLGSGVAGHVVRTGRPEILPDIESEQRIPKALRHHFPGRAGASFPLISRNRVIGTINMIGQEPPFRFTETMLIIGREIGVAVENQRLYEELQRKEAALADLTDQVIQAQEAERKRIARELHDEVGQALTGIRINLSLIEKAVEVADELDRRPFKSLYELIDETLENVSRLSYDLRPAMLDDLGLPTAIQWYCRNFRERTGIRAILTVRGKLDSLPDRIGTYLYRFLQESLTNVARHAKARTARVTVTRAGHHISIRVTDDGCGFDPLRILSGRELRTGQGLFGLRGRTEILGGKMEIVSQEGKGTTLTARIPSE